MTILHDNYTWKFFSFLLDKVRNIYKCRTFLIKRRGMNTIVSIRVTKLVLKLFRGNQCKFHVQEFHSIPLLNGTLLCTFPASFMTCSVSLFFSTIAKNYFLNSYLIFYKIWSSVLFNTNGKVVMTLHWKNKILSKSIEK